MRGPGTYAAQFKGKCPRCKRDWKPGDDIGTVRRSLLYPPESRRSMNSTQLGETVRLCAACAGEVSR